MANPAYNVYGNHNDKHAAYDVAGWEEKKEETNNLENVIIEESRTLLFCCIPNFKLLYMLFFRKVENSRPAEEKI